MWLMCFGITVCLVCWKLVGRTGCLVGWKFVLTKKIVGEILKAKCWKKLFKVCQEFIRWK